MTSTDYTAFLRVMFEIGAKIHHVDLLHATAELIGIAEREIPLNDEGEAD